MPDGRITIRLPKRFAAEVRVRAAAAGLSVSGYIRRSLLASEGTVETVRDIADRDEALALLTESARAGNVPAQKALLDAFTPKASAKPAARHSDESKPVTSPLDELATRRRR